MTHVSAPTAIHAIAFTTDSAKTSLLELDAALGGLKVTYSDESPRHYLGLDLNAKEGGCVIGIGGSWADSPDLCVTTILGKITEYCVDGELTLVVDPMSSGLGRREFKANLNIDGKLLFKKIQLPSKKFTPLV